MSDEMFLGTITPNGTASDTGGTLRLNRVPILDGGIRISDKVLVARVILDEFTVEAARDVLRTLGFSMIDRSVHGVGLGSGFFFDFKAERA